MVEDRKVDEGLGSQSEEIAAVKLGDFLSTRQPCHQQTYPRAFFQAVPQSKAPKEVP